MSSSSPPSWRPTNEEILQLGSGFFGFVPAALGVPYLAPLASLVIDYAYRRRDRLFTLFRDDVIVPGQAWNPWARPVAAQSGHGRVAEYDLLSLLGRRLLSEQRITVTPRLTREARAAGLRAGDPVPVAVVDRSWNNSESGLIVPAQVDRPVTVALPRGDYGVLALGSPGDRLFRAHDPYLATGGARVAPERRSSVDVTLLPRASQRALKSNVRVAPRSQRSGVRCIYCGKQPREELFLRHMLSCPQRPNFGPRSGAAAPAAVCMVCHQTFADRSVLQAHMRSRHREFSAEMLGRKRKDDSDRRAGIRSPSRRRVVPRGRSPAATQAKARAAPPIPDKGGRFARTQGTKAAGGADRGIAGARGEGVEARLLLRDSQRTKPGISDRPSAARRDFIEQIAKRGFWLGPGAKHVYYHDVHYLAPRIVLTGTRIRFEIGNTRTGKYELWQSYRLVDEADLALGAIAELKKRPKR